MNFNLYKDFEINLKTDQLINKFAPFNRNQLLELVKISLENNQSIDDLHRMIMENKNISFEIIKEKLVNSFK